MEYGLVILIDSFHMQAYEAHGQAEKMQIYCTTGNGYHVSS